MTLTLVLLLMMGLYSFLGYIYYAHQNASNVIGGSISRAKIIWLTYTTFIYFLGSVFVYRTSAHSLFSIQLFVFICLIYFRAVAQLLLMFVFKKWIPPMGMAYNIVCCLVLWSMPFKYGFADSAITYHSLPVFIYVVILTIAMITDTYYAYAFFCIVKRSTTGVDAIWYASEDDVRFKKINRLTSRMNKLYLFLLLLFIVSYAHATTL